MVIQRYSALPLAFSHRPASIKPNSLSGSCHLCSRSQQGLSICGFGPGPPSRVTELQDPAQHNEQKFIECATLRWQVRGAASHLDLLTISCWAEGREGMRMGWRQRDRTQAPHAGQKGRAERVGVSVEPSVWASDKQIYPFLIEKCMEALGPPEV